LINGFEREEIKVYGIGCESSFKRAYYCGAVWRRGGNTGLDILKVHKKILETNYLR
jgi:hypothetical protein